MGWFQKSLKNHFKSFLTSSPSTSGCTIKCLKMKFLFLQREVLHRLEFRIKICLGLDHCAWDFRNLASAKIVKS
jgi:hypothetical protein